MLLLNLLLRLQSVALLLLLLLGLLFEQGCALLSFSLQLFGGFFFAALLLREHRWRVSQFSWVVGTSRERLLVCVPRSGCDWGVVVAAVKASLGKLVRVLVAVPQEVDCGWFAVADVRLVSRSPSSVPGVPGVR